MSKDKLLSTQSFVVKQVLLLDELTTFLDSTDQEGVLRAVRDVVGQPGSDPVTALWVRNQAALPALKKTHLSCPCMQSSFNLNLKEVRRLFCCKDTL